MQKNLESSPPHPMNAGKLTAIHPNPACDGRVWGNHATVNLSQLQAADYRIAMLRPMRHGSERCDVSEGDGDAGRII